MDALREAARTLSSRSTAGPILALRLDPALPDVTPAGPPDAALALPGGGDLALRRLAGVPAAVWSDAPERTPAERAFPVRVARLLGARTLLAATRAGALAPDPRPAAAGLGVVEDHVGFLLPNPLVGPNLDELGTRFPDLTAAYDPDLRALARAEAEALGWALPGGILAGWPDPNLAGAPEYTVLQEAGVTWLGSGGVQETIVARHAGMRVLTLIALAGAEEALARLIARVIARLGEPGFGGAEQGGEEPPSRSGPAGAG